MKEFRDEDLKSLDLLHRGIVMIRAINNSIGNKTTAKLADILHNLPHHIANGEPIDMDWINENLRKWEDDHNQGGHPITEGPSSLN